MEIDGRAGGRGEEGKGGGGERRGRGEEGKGGGGERRGRIY